jgi:hypothetical protein
MLLHLLLLAGECYVELSDLEAQSAAAAAALKSNDLHHYDS